MATGAPGITSMSSGKEGGEGEGAPPFVVPPRSVNPKFMLKLRGQSLGWAISIYKGTLQSSPVVCLLLPSPEGFGWGSCCILCHSLHFTLHSVAIWETSLRLSSVCFFSDTPRRMCSSGKGLRTPHRECWAAASTAGGCRLSESPLSA